MRREELSVRHLSIFPIPKTVENYFLSCTWYKGTICTGTIARSFYRQRVDGLPPGRSIDSS